MPSSGGSVSDAPVNKVVDGQDHQLSYITPGEANTLVNQGGVPTMTDSGVMAYPPPGERGGPGSGSEGRSQGGEGRGQYQSPTPAPTGGDYDDNVVNTYSPTTNIENIHGEHDDPDSASYDQYYNPTAQAAATKASAMGTGKYAGDSRWNPATGKMERSQDYTFTEHWNRAPDAIKFSPTLRFLYASGKNVGEWANRKGFEVNRSGTNTTDPTLFTGGNGNERDKMNALAPEAPYIVSGITAPTSSPASNWYANLGTTNTNQHATSIATQYAAAKTAVSTTLKNKGAIGMLAVNQSPFYDWLKTNKIDKGIL